MKHKEAASFSTSQFVCLPYVLATPVRSAPMENAIVMHVLSVSQSKYRRTLSYMHL